MALIPETPVEKSIEEIVPPQEVAKTEKSKIQGMAKGLWNKIGKTPAQSKVEAITTETKVEIQSILTSPVT